MAGKKRLVVLVILAGFWAVVPDSWAGNSPEPQSGGRFFAGKGTRAAYSNENCAKTESGHFERYQMNFGLKPS